MNRPLRVFLCHSSNDKPAVCELYQKLRAEPWIQPWLDEEELYPGMDWNMEIEKAVENSDVVLVCLSKGSINKRGYVQKELRFALDIALEMPEETIFIIPLRLEECTPPRSLRDWQYADYFEGQRDHASERLMVSLKRRAESLGFDTKTRNITQETLLNIEKDTDAILLKKAILIIKGEKFASISRLQRLLHIQHAHATRMLDKLEELGIVGPPQGSFEEREVFVGEDNLEGKKDEIDWKKIVQDLEPEIGETTVEPFEKETSLSRDREDLSKHPAPEWIASNEIKLSNGMEFRLVPLGTFIMGDSGGDKDEILQHQVYISHNYWMARFPVTNDQYTEYVRHHPPYVHPVTNWENKKEYPVTLVNWYDATEYCKWLNDLLKNELPSGHIVRLPTEAEWEKAARSKNGRKYPWGDDFDEKKCNMNGSIYPVGLYSPQGDSPFGCADMMGNVYEWTHSLGFSYPYHANDGRESSRRSGRMVIRGGSYGVLMSKPYCARRSYHNIDDKKEYIGFRICLAPPLPK